MDSYYAFGATSVLCGNRGLSLLYDFLCACIITDLESENKKPSLNTFTSFQLFPSFHNLLQLFTTCSFPPFSLYTFPPSEPTEAVKGKGKSIAGILWKKEPIWRTVTCRSNRLFEFSAILFPPWRGRWGLIESTQIFLSALNSLCWLKTENVQHNFENWQKNNEYDKI